MANRGERVAQAYARLRASVWFPTAVIVVIAGWIAAHFVFHVDPVLSGANLFLSVEATVATSLLMVDVTRNASIASAQEAARAKQLRYLLHLTESIMALLDRERND